mmetsp:Transcript_35330/g.31778  ORF Transcript_35330/g.31778 Transcript_35330/m.31778 type:complete len:91 (+) Transcript_35330:1292-1564(+)
MPRDEDLEGLVFPKTPKDEENIIAMEILNSDPDEASEEDFDPRIHLEKGEKYENKHERDTFRAFELENKFSDEEQNKRFFMNFVLENYQK